METPGKRRSLRRQSINPESTGHERIPPAFQFHLEMKAGGILFRSILYHILHVRYTLMKEEWTKSIPQVGQTSPFSFAAS